MRLSLLIAMILVVSLASSTRADAKTYYVSASTSAKDSNDGSQGKPWKTFAHAIGNMLPGDTLLLEAGTYEQQLRFSKDGLDAQQGFTIKAAPGAKVIIDGKGALPTKANEGLIEVEATARFVRIEGLEVRNSKEIGVHVMGNDVTLRGSVVRDNQQQGVFFFKTQRGRIEGNTVHNNVLVNKSRTLANVNPAVGSFQATDLEVVGNTIYRNYGDGVGVTEAQDHLIRGNTLYDNVNSNIIVGNADKTVIDANFVYCTAQSGFENPTSGERPTGIALGEPEATPLSAGWVVSNNIVTRCHINLLWYDNTQLVGEGLKGLVAHNTLTQAVDIGLVVEAGAHQASVVNNIVVQANGQLVFVPTPLSGLTFSHNNWFGGKPQAAAGTGDVIGNCQLKDGLTGTTPGDFEIAAGSPCIDKGKALTAVQTDYFGLARPAGSGADIGAHEHGAKPGADAGPVDLGVDGALSKDVGVADGASDTGPGRDGSSSEGLGGDHAVEDDDGCGCGVAASPGGWPVALLLLLGLALRCRRRRGGSMFRGERGERR